MTGLTPEQQRNLDATVAAVQRIAMHIVTLPKKHRAKQYAAVRRTFEETIQEFGVEGETARKWLDGTMDMLRALVLEIETGGGAGGGRAWPEGSTKGEPCTLADKQVRFHSEQKFKYGRQGHRMFSACHTVESDDWEWAENETVIRWRWRGVWVGSQLSDYAAVISSVERLQRSWERNGWSQNEHRTELVAGNSNALIDN